MGNTQDIVNTWEKIRPILVSFVTVCSILTISAVLIAYGRGYRINIQQQKVSTTGLLAITSDPSGAAVYINDKLTTVSNDTIPLVPGSYTVRIQKEGYQPWEKTLQVKGEVVTRADIYFFPSTPSLSVITKNGIIAPSLSPDGKRLAYIIPNTDTSSTQLKNPKDPWGVWVTELSTSPISVSKTTKKVLSPDTTPINDGVLSWSPDSSDLLVILPHPITKGPVYYLVSPDKENVAYTPLSELNTLKDSWTTQASDSAQVLLGDLRGDALRIATESSRLLALSYDKSKILYEATASTTLAQVITPPPIGTHATEEIRTIEPDTYYVYDIKEDKNYKIGSSGDFQIWQQPKNPKQPNDIVPLFSAPFDPEIVPFITNNARPLQWLSTSRHLLFVKDNTVNVVEYDGSMRQMVYSGPLMDGFVIPWFGENKFLILSNFNTQFSPYPALYSVNLR
jgi:hypothetical protein